MNGLAAQSFLPPTWLHVALRGEPADDFPNCVYLIFFAIKLKGKRRYDN